MKTIYRVVILTFLTGVYYAQNPIVPPGVYIADPSAHVWKDGKVYVYGSRDESPDYYCSRKYDVLSSDDLINWIINENSFASYGVADQVRESDDVLYAPDVQFKNGTYYLFYCLGGENRLEGVAASKSPVGPFTGGKVLDVGGINEIDPAVFLDDDGQAYYIWGQYAAKIAKLKPTMTEIDPATINDKLLTEREHGFHEGGYMVKHKSVYYFVYTRAGRAGAPTAIAYATAKAPMGPFRYRGVIIDNDHSDPGVWNNQGSLVEFKGKWYVFYHRSTHGSKSMRKVCVEPITFNRDSTINEVEMTSQGAGPPLNATEQIDAERTCLLFGNARIQAFARDNEKLAGIRNGDRAAYKYIDFKEGVDSVTVKVITGKRPGRIDIALDHPWRRIGSVEIPVDGDGKAWRTITGKVKNTKGIHAVWLTFAVDGEHGFSVDWFRFGK